MLAEQYDLGALCPSAQRRWLVRLAEGTPVVGMTVLPALWLKPPAAIGVALETDQRALVMAPRAVFEAGALREPAAIFAPTPKLPPAYCSRPLETSWLMYRRSCSGVMPVPVSVTDSLRTRPRRAR
jgi:hypothetical protein